MHAADIHVHRHRGLPAREQAALPKHFPITNDAEFDAALTARAVINADLREETIRFAPEVNAQLTFGGCADAAAKLLSGDAEACAGDRKVGSGNAPTGGHPREIKRREPYSVCRHYRTAEDDRAGAAR